MRKLTLNKVRFAGAEVLTRDQLKNVMGGNVMFTDGEGGTGQCGTYPNCSTNSCTARSGPCEGYSGTCGKTVTTKSCSCGVIC